MELLSSHVHLLYQIQKSCSLKLSEMLYLCFIQFRKVKILYIGIWVTNLSCVRFVGRFSMRGLHDYGLTCLDNRWRLIQVGICLWWSHAIWRCRIEISFSYINAKRKDIITFCDKTITNLKSEIETIKQNLKTILNKKQISRSTKHYKFQPKHQRSLLKTTQAKNVQSSKIWTRANSTVFTKRRRIHLREDQTAKKDKFRTQCLWGKVTVK